MFKWRWIGHYLKETFKVCPYWERFLVTVHDLIRFVYLFPPALQYLGPSAVARLHKAHDMSDWADDHGSLPTLSLWFSLPPLHRVPASPQDAAEGMAPPRGRDRHLLKKQNKTNNIRKENDKPLNLIAMGTRTSPFKLLLLSQPPHPLFPLLICIVRHKGRHDGFCRDGNWMKNNQKGGQPRGHPLYDLLLREGSYSHPARGREAGTQAGNASEGSLDGGRRGIILALSFWKKWRTPPPPAHIFSTISIYASNNMMGRTRIMQAAHSSPTLHFRETCPRQCPSAAPLAAAEEPSPQADWSPVPPGARPQRSLRQKTVFLFLIFFWLKFPQNNE